MLFASIHTSYSQSLKFQHIGVEQGLSQDIVTAIARDSLGFMWFGTEDGLNRYDGYTMLTFKQDPRDTTSLYTSIIRSLMVDSFGRLWIGTTGYCSIMDPATLRMKRLAESVSAFCEGGDSVVLFSTDTGLHRYHPDGRIERIASDEKWLRANVMYFDKKANLLFAGSVSGLRIFSLFHNILTPRSSSSATKALEGKDVCAICRSSSGDIFVGTINAGLFRISSDLERVEQFVHDENNPQSLSDNRVLTLNKDHRQRIWVGTFDGLDLFDAHSGSFVRYKDDNAQNGLRGVRVYAICPDPNGALWVGTYRGGVNRHDPHRQKFTHVAYEPDKQGGLRGQNVFSITETDDGDLWVGTDNGLFRRRKGATLFRQYKKNPRTSHTLSSDVIFALCQRQNGELWAGGMDGVAGRYEPASDGFVRYRLPVPEVGGAIRSMYETRDGRLLVGTESRGAFVLDSLRQKFVDWEVHGDTAQSAGVWTMYEDRAGFLWLGTFYVSYIVRFSPGSKTSEKIYADATHETGLVIPSVRTFCENFDQSLYLGTWGGGFARYDHRSNQYSWYTESKGLSSNYVKAMQSDAKGKIWIATEKGLTRYDPKTESFRTYTVEDGLQSNFFWSGSSWKGKGGKLFFGGTNGFNEFHPDSVSDNANIPRVVITSVRVLDKPFPIQDEEGGRTINLSYRADFFSFEFVALDYTSPERNQYAYKLEGFDEKWVNAGPRRYAAYTHLDPGRYVFRVKGSNSDGVWNEAGASMIVIISPPYWMTWWFRSALVLALASGLYGIYRYRLNQIIRVERLRQRIARDLHDDIGTNLSAIVIACEVIRQQQQASPAILEQVKEIGNISINAQELTHDIVWMLDPKNDTLKEFIGRMKHEAARLFKGIEYSVSAPEGELPDKVSLEFKRNMFLIYKEALNNIVRHARAGRVDIHLAFENAMLTLRITDDGVGFDIGKASHGNGLVNMRARAEHIGAVLRLESSPGKGSILELEVRIT